MIPGKIFLILDIKIVQREAGNKKRKLYPSQVTHVLKSLYLKSWKPKPVQLSNQSWPPVLPPTKTKKDQGMASIAPGRDRMNEFEWLNCSWTDSSNT